MKVITSPVEIQTVAQDFRAKQLTIGLVPTMGFFHNGHVALMKEAGRRADKVIVSLFVNPLQFGPSEDFDTYPHAFEKDCQIAEDAGVDILYTPNKKDMYSEEFATTIQVKGLTSGLCGGDRPGHFDGVTTVVGKLFNQTLPHIAVFGEKDFQQLAVIRQFVRDLDFPVSIIGYPIVREANGLAMSSRNSYLKKDEMDAALCLSTAIRYAKNLVRKQQNIAVSDIEKKVADTLLKHSECTIDYIQIVHQNTLQNCTQISSDSILLIAVKINNRIRLIDNSKLTGG